MTTQPHTLPALDLRSDDFALFGLPRRFAQNEAELDTIWKRLLAQVHPDKFAAQGEQAQRLAMQWSVRVNEAHQRLRQPVQRAAYLCALAGHDVAQMARQPMSPSFLMQQMQWREALDAAGQDEAALQSLWDEAQAWQQAALAEVAQLLDAQQDAAAAALRVRELGFVQKFQAALEDHWPI